MKRSGLILLCALVVLLVGAVGSAAASAQPTGGFEVNVASGDPPATETNTSLSGGGASECTTAIGSATVVLTKEGEREKQSITNKLYTNPTATQKQRLIFRWAMGANEFVLTKLTTASCTVFSTRKAFNGMGEGTVNGEGGWLVNFSLRLNNQGGFTFIIRLRKSEELLAFTDRAVSLSSETIS